MLLRRKIPFRTQVKAIWKRLALLIAYAAVFAFLIPDITIPFAIVAVLGVALAILLVFRAHAGFARWWEARAIWGGIVNDSRTFGRQVLSVVEADNDVKRELVYRQIAFPYALRSTLRRQDPLEGLDGLLSESELEALRAQASVPNAILLTQARRLGDLHASDSVPYRTLDETLTRFNDHMGECERIKSAVPPARYTYFVTGSVWLFSLLAAPALVPYLSWLTVLVAPLVGLIFWLLEFVGRALQTPFANAPADMPMTAFCRNIEINARHQLGETDLPPMMKPVNGILM